ncbi:MarR family transcriptional regulator [Beduinella massiliensis]|uniref:MarR family transcriptional regulator n=1 Tax=Beduinella massiliensis TaxID=1852363 RepID=UPI000C8276A6
MPKVHSPQRFVAFADEIRQFYRVESEQLLKLGVRATHCTMLHYLIDHPGMIQQELAEIYGASRSTMSGMLSDMEACGLIERRADPENRRCVRVFLTDHGLALAQEIRAAFWSYCERLLSDFTQEEVDQLEGFLEKLRR